MEAKVEHLPASRSGSNIRTEKPPIHQNGPPVKPAKFL
ncbi:hypothetical protein SFR_2434 [Streptomyces sp. FR-008]|nr:hypothetical protein SFR_2434 [Streptomyces sp. FR-008]